MEPTKNASASDAAAATHDATGTGKKRRTNVGKACLNCRRRKARCDGIKPSCKTCLVYNDECAWGEEEDGRKPASRQYVNSLRNRIKALEGMLREKGQDVLPDDDDEEEEREEVAEMSNTMLHLHMGEAGEEVHFHGPTSAYAHSSHSHNPSTFDGEQSPAIGRPHDYRRYLPPTVPITFAQHAKILDRFFRYFASWCLRAVPDLFHQDMIRAVTLPPNTPPPRFSHYSPFLHNIILATALRWSDDAELDTQVNRLAFAANAEFHLLRELPRPTLATVQGLGIKSSYHSTLGDHTSGWCYFGMADRAAHSLGLNIDCAALVDNARMSQQEMLLVGLAQFLADERRNTFWTIFTQEQVWSVYIGRPHAIQEYSTPIPIVDRKLDEMQWTWDNEDGPLKGSPSQDCMFSSAFVETAKLSVIMHRVMTTLYSLRSDIMKLQKDNTLSELGLALDAWNEQLPPSLVLSGHSWRNALPHILLLQLSREWLTILIHRPYYRPIMTMHKADKTEGIENFFSLAVRRCDRAAARINSLLATYHERFGLRFSPPTLFNITFTAGTTHLLAAVRHKSSKIKNDAFESANDCVRFLQYVGESWPAAMHKAEILDGLVKEYHLTGSEDVLSSPSPEMFKKGKERAGSGAQWSSESKPRPVVQPPTESPGESVFAGSYEMPPVWAHPMASTQIPPQRHDTPPQRQQQQQLGDWNGLMAANNQGFGTPSGGAEMQDPFLSSLLSQMTLPPPRQSGQAFAHDPPPGPPNMMPSQTPPSVSVGRNPFGGFSPFAVPEYYAGTQNTHLAAQAAQKYDPACLQTGSAPGGAAPSSSLGASSSHGGMNAWLDAQDAQWSAPFQPPMNQQAQTDDVMAFYELLASHTSLSPAGPGFGVESPAANVGPSAGGAGAPMPMPMPIPDASGARRGADVRERVSGAGQYDGLATSGPRADTRGGGVSGSWKGYFGSG